MSGSGRRGVVSVTHEQPASESRVYVVVDKGVGAWEAWTTPEAAHQSIEGDEHLFDVFDLPLREARRGG
jgi:hypothetical protein